MDGDSDEQRADEFSRPASAAVPEPQGRGGRAKPTLNPETLVPESAPYGHAWAETPPSPKGGRDPLIPPPVPEESESTLRLQSAARSGDIAKMSAALNDGGDMEATDLWGLRALHNAAMGNHVMAVEFLLDRGALIDATSNRGQTAIHYAVSERHVDVINFLFKRRSDVLQRTGHGNSTLEIAQQFGRQSVCVNLVQSEIERRWREANTELTDLQRRILLAEHARATAEAQLGRRPGSDTECTDEKAKSAEGDKEEERDEPAVEAIEEGGPPTVTAEDTERKNSKESGTKEGEMLFTVLRSKEFLSESGNATPRSGAGVTKKARGAKKSHGVAVYWQTLERLAERSRTLGSEAVDRAFTRDMPTEFCDPFPWTGELTAEGSILPDADPEDEVLLRGYAKLQAAAEDRGKREAKRTFQVEVDERVKEHKDAEMRRQTGRTQKEWEILVAELKETQKWDWSRIEVKERKGIVDKGLSMFGVFARKAPTPVPTSRGQTRSLADMMAGKPAKLTPEEIAREAPPPEPLFVQSEVIGPMGGTIRRRSQYERVHYHGGKWSIHNGCVLELQLRAQTAELKTEALVIDFLSGESRNRLRHIADARYDPMDLRSLLAGSLNVQEVFRTRQSMPRPRSRPRSPYRPSDRVEAKSSGEVVQSPSEAHKSDRPFPEGYGAAVNVNLIEVCVDGWPYVFAVALRDIMPSEELAVDLGELHWMGQRLLLARLHEIGRLGRDITVGVRGSQADEEEEAAAAVAEDPSLRFRRRAPMRRIKVNPDPLNPHKER
eukprot:TRINITY_DN67510_c0_g1_i1.p1 TRINITY_DN67510_c0_g1~~TRINITY_DN67510_c0_g1_i1.p1  ORF type:complete len:799 (-),score=132.18 TRINITY_DN67510_c0_g1_i1:300-2633(-)